MHSRMRESIVRNIEVLFSIRVESKKGRISISLREVSVIFLLKKFFKNVVFPVPLPPSTRMVL